MAPPPPQAGPADRNRTLVVRRQVYPLPSVETPASQRDPASGIRGHRAREGAGLRAGDVGVVVEHYEAYRETPEGYELEFFSARGETVAVVSVPATAVRMAESHELLTVRRFQAS
jgi:hypothetical protein